MDSTLTLITNDDGIDSPGLFRLALSARELGLDVVVAAPAAEASGSSASITAFEKDGRIFMEQRQVEGLEGVACYAVHAAPALITLIASHGAFGAAPDLVLSGINRGANVGRAILHSGTVGAALTAGVNGGRGLAVSLDVGTTTGMPLTDALPTVPRWGLAARLAASLIPRLLEQPPGTVLNLNVPQQDSFDADLVPEIREAELASFGIVQTTMTEQDQQQIRLAVADATALFSPGSDAALLAAGFATVTSLQSVGHVALPDGFLHLVHR
jgi:5'-nucleotidase